MLNICLSWNESWSKFCDPSKVEIGWIFLRPFIFPLLISRLNPVMVLSHTDGDSGMKKIEAMMGTLTGTGLTWFLTCMIYCRKIPPSPLWVMSNLWRFMSCFTVIRHTESTITACHCEWVSVSVCDFSYVNKCRLQFTSAFVFTWTPTSPVDNIRVKCFQK